MAKILMGETTIGEVSYKSSPEDRRAYAGQILERLRYDFDAHGGMWEVNFYTHINAQLDYCECCHQQAWKWSLRIIHTESMERLTVHARWHNTTNPVVEIYRPRRKAANGEGIMAQIIGEFNELTRLKAAMKGDK